MCPGTAGGGGVAQPHHFLDETLVIVFDPATLTGLRHALFVLHAFLPIVCHDFTSGGVHTQQQQRSAHHQASAPFAGEAVDAHDTLGRRLDPAFHRLCQAFHDTQWWYTMVVEGK